MVIFTQKGVETMKKFLNAIAAFIAFLLGIVLSILLIAAPYLNAVLDLLEPDNIYEIVSTVDYGELMDSLNVQIPTQEGQDPEATEEYVEQILSSDLGKDLLDTFADRLADGKDLSQRDLMNIVENNIDEIADIAKDYYEKTQGTELEITQEELKEQILTHVEENAEELTKNFAVSDQLEQVLPAGLNVKQTMGLLTGDLPKLAVLAAAVLLSVLILLLRLKEAKGFKSLTRIFFSAAITAAAPVLVLSIPNLVTTVTGMSPSVIDPVTKFLQKSVLMDAIYIAAAGVFCLIVVGIYLIVAKAKAHNAQKAAKQAQPVYAAPVPPAAYAPVYAPVAPAAAAPETPVAVAPAAEPVASVESAPTVAEPVVVAAAEPVTEPAAEEAAPEIVTEEPEAEVAAEEPVAEVAAEEAVRPLEEEPAKVAFEPEEAVQEA
jgi:hypothetical protein